MLLSWPEDANRSRSGGEDFQDRLITALEAEWAKVVDSDDAAVIGQGDKKARAIGTFARTGRSLVIMVGAPVFVYTAAMRAADFPGGPGGAARVRVAQGSAIQGWGASVDALL